MRSSSLTLAFTMASLLVFTTSSSASGFIENRGQVDPTVAYYATGSGAGVYFTPEAVVLDLVQPPEAGEEVSSPAHHARGGRAAEQESTPRSRKGCAIWIRFEGADPAPAIEGRDRLSARYNYFLGNDPTRWRTDVPAYEEIVYRGLWLGIDLVLRQNGAKLEYQVMAEPGSGSNRVRFRYEGAGQVVVEAGTARVATPLGELIDTRPSLAGGVGSFAWQEEASPAGLRDDPGLLLWSTFLGGDDDESGEAVTLDDAGNIVVAGMTYSPDFPTTPGAYDITHDGPCDAFVSMFDPSGSTLLWSTYLGGNSSDACYAVDLDGSGNPVVTGGTYSSGFPTTAGAYDESYNGMDDVFVTKIDASGSSLLWSTFLGGDDSEEGNDLKLDDLGSPILTGWTSSSDFPATSGAYDETPNGGLDAFVAKLDAAGSSLSWCTYLGGTAADDAAGFQIDWEGNVILVGCTFSPGFPTTPGAYSETHSGSCDAFVTLLDNSGSSLLWSTFLGGTGYDTAWQVAYDPVGNPILVGGTESTDFPTTPGAYDESHNGYQDAFVTMIDPAGDALLWSTFLGGTESDEAYGLSLDSFGNPIVSGYTDSADFPTTASAYDESYNGNGDAFVAAFEVYTGSFLSSTYLGASGFDHGIDVVAAPDDAAIVTGQTDGSDFPTTSGAYDETYNGGFSDAFVAKIELPQESEPICDVSPTSIDFGAVPLGQYVDELFTITNVGEGTLEGWAGASCDYYEIIAGDEAPYSLGPGEYHDVIVRFQPTVPGTYTCNIETGSGLCEDVECTGDFLDEPVCELSTTSLEFGVVAVGDYLDRAFSITNTGTGILSGSVSESGDDYWIVSGGGSYNLANGQSVTVTVRFEPTIPESLTCTIETGSAYCADVHCDGDGGTPISLVEWQDLVVSSERAFTCLEGDGSWLSITVRDGSGDPLPGAEVEGQLDSTCDLCECVPFRATADSNGVVAFPMRVGVDASADTSCCVVSVTVTAAGDSIAWRGTGRALTDSRDWVSPDLDGDCDVDAGDAAIFYLDANTQACRSDFDGNGFVDIADLAILARHTNHTCNPPVGADGAVDALPLVHSLSQNRPNPFQPPTRIAFAIAATGPVQLKVYNVLGQPVRTLVDRPLPAGHHEVAWDGRDERGRMMASGVYFYRLETRDYSQTRKMVFMK
jgi:hypothetical protein